MSFFTYFAVRLLPKPITIAKILGSRAAYSSGYAFSYESWLHEQIDNSVAAGDRHEIIRLKEKLQVVMSENKPRILLLRNHSIAKKKRAKNPTRTKFRDPSNQSPDYKGPRRREEDRQLQGMQ